MLSLLSAVPQLPDAVITKRKRRRQRYGEAAAAAGVFFFRGAGQAQPKDEVSRCCTR